MTSWVVKEQARARLAREIVLPGGGFRGPAGIRACILYPNTYRVGMSNLGFQTIHAILNATPGLSCERAFLPDPPGRAGHGKARDGIISLETQTPLAEFDLIGVSVSYEMDYPNVTRALLEAGIPPLARDRDERHPLVLAGGPCITFNPEPLAEFVDLCAIGEGEEIVPGIAAVLRDVSMARGASRAELLAALAEQPGVYVPSLYEPEYTPDGSFAGLSPQAGAPERIERQWVRDLDRSPCASLILTPETEFGDLFCIEISRGCGRGCRYCAAGYITRPPRIRSRAHLLEGVRAALPHRRRIGLVSPAISDYPDLPGLLNDLAEMGAEVSLSSLRADTLLSSPTLALAGSGESAITIAPEAGSQRLRFALNKSLTDEEIYAAVENALAAGIHKVKLYLMLGLPTETEADIDAAVEMCQRIASYPGIRQVTVSANPFVPKPGTPFQWCAMQSEAVLSARRKRLHTGLKTHKKLSLGGESPREAIIQGALSRGDRRLAPVLLSVAGGQSWNAAFREAGIDPAAFACHEIEPGAPLPWDHLHLGAGAECLKREWSIAQSAATHPRGGLTPACQPGACRRCEACSNA